MTPTSFYYVIVNDIRNFVFGLAGATVYGSCKSRKQKFVMSFTIIHGRHKIRLQISVSKVIEKQEMFF